jgi:hypothetical protein
LRATWKRHEIAEALRRLGRAEVALGDLEAPEVLLRDVDALKVLLHVAEDVRQLDRIAAGDGVLRVLRRIDAEDLHRHAPDRGRDAVEVVAEVVERLLASAT